MGRRLLGNRLRSQPFCNAGTWTGFQQPKSQFHSMDDDWPAYEELIFEYQ
jgi:hypothetical protein